MCDRVQDSGGHTLLSFTLSDTLVKDLFRKPYQVIVFVKHKFSYLHIDRQYNQINIYLRYVWVNLKNMFVEVEHCITTFGQYLLVNSFCVLQKTEIVVNQKLKTLKISAFVQSASQIDIF